ncbi:MAG: trypsin-like peptidase domain-containing protein [Planctomycetes bacterium]|nr:trypsin-like peptidase domain-containing protein [Planctomycetota bacterium]
MALSYPENTVWYIEARPWSGTKKEPGFAPVKAVSMGSGVVVTFTRTLENGECKIRTYILTCAHVVRSRDKITKERDDLLLEDIICYPPGKGFIGTAEKSRKSGTIDSAYAKPASVSTYSPCKSELGPRLEHLRNDPASDWVLLEIHDPAFRNQLSVNALHKENLLVEQRIQAIGFPGGAVDWKNGSIVEVVTARDFRFRVDSEAGMFNYEGPEEARPGMSGCGIFDEKGTLVGIHRSSTDAVMKRSGIRADAIARQLLEKYQMDFSPGVSSNRRRKDWWSALKRPFFAIVVCGCLVVIPLWVRQIHTSKKVLWEQNWHIINEYHGEWCLNVAPEEGGGCWTNREQFLSILNAFDFVNNKELEKKREQLIVLVRKSNAHPKGDQYHNMSYTEEIKSLESELKRAIRNEAVSYGISIDNDRRD